MSTAGQIQLNPQPPRKHRQPRCLPSRRNTSRWGGLRGRPGWQYVGDLVFARSNEPRFRQYVGDMVFAGEE
jgi:hypothetical protein